MSADKYDTVQRPIATDYIALLSDGRAMAVTNKGSWLLPAPLVLADRPSGLNKLEALAASRRPVPRERVVEVTGDGSISKGPFVVDSIATRPATAEPDRMTMRIVTPSGWVWEWTWSEAGGVDEHAWKPSEGWESSRGMYCEDDALALFRAAEVLHDEPGSALTLHGTACTSSSAPKAQKTSP